MSILELLAVTQWSPTGSTHVMEIGSLGLKNDDDISNFTILPGEIDFAQVGGPLALIAVRTWPILLMNSQAENASPRIWAQLMPSDIPPHLNHVTCRVTRVRGRENYKKEKIKGIMHITQTNGSC